MKKSKFTEQQIAFNRQKAGHRLPRCAGRWALYGGSALPFNGYAAKWNARGASASAHW